ncbi:unnamed protein product [Rangifer tarandus platyrhynchus]|uniref:Uncharacterized protein n=2 Tax=Rangifer tarandus platyrhynchus TaxID=3082113 RepID=A0AC59ZFG6_RANTA|nr:unnamed protein product [Rangifer tarandus platyrhynchus]
MFSMKKKIPRCHQVIFKAVNHRSHQPISFSMVKKGATISGKCELCLPNPSSLRPGAVFITNCSEPDRGGKILYLCLAAQYHLCSSYSGSYPSHNISNLSCY